jgi:hypothetical protein
MLMLHSQKVWCWDHSWTFYQSLKKASFLLLTIFIIVQSQCLTMFQIMANLMTHCRNPSLGLATKATTCKGASQKWSPWVTFHILESLAKFEGMNPHIHKWAPTLGVVIPMEFRIFRRQLQGSKFIKSKRSSHHWKVLRT